MFRWPLCLLLFLLLCPSVQAGSAPKCDLAIANVNVVPMNSNRVLKAHTVRIRDGVIASVEPARQPARPCAKTLNARGKYLLPGLNDMHIHLEAEMFQKIFGVPGEPVIFEDVLFAYLANGVTGVRVMSGSPDILAFRLQKQRLAPLIMVGSPMLSGAPPSLPEPVTRIVTSPETARGAVREFAAAGYDFIKLRDSLDAGVLAAVAAETVARGLLLDGHLSRALTHLPTERRGIAHINELSLRVMGGERVETIIKQLKACACFVTTTLIIAPNVAEQLRDYDRLAARPESRHVHPLVRRALWDKARNPYIAEAQDPAFFDRLARTDAVIVRALHAANVPLLAGTDALIPMILPGYSLHDELALLVEAGLSPYDALRTATTIPATVFKPFAQTGAISVGRKANLVLVSENPLRSLSVLRKPDAVIVIGTLLERHEIDERLSGIAERFAALP
jgi:hypothetical protein